MNNEDENLKEFLQDLDNATDHIDLTDWEAEFVGNTAYTKYDFYTDKQRDVIRKLKYHYGSLL
jgi:hypothetical protein